MKATIEIDFKKYEVYLTDLVFLDEVGWRALFRWDHPPIDRQHMFGATVYSNDIKVAIKVANTVKDHKIIQEEDWIFARMCEANGEEPGSESEKLSKLRECLHGCKRRVRKIDPPEGGEQSLQYGERLPNWTARQKKVISSFRNEPKDMSTVRRSSVGRRIPKMDTTTGRSSNLPPQMQKQSDFRETGVFALGRI